MLASAGRIRDEQRSIWDEFSAGWKKWDAELLGWHAPFGEALLQEVRLRPDAWVLDVAAGSGEPGLNAAEQVQAGRVVLADISAGMLRVAREKASARGLNNLDFEVCDAAALPFEDEHVRRRVLPLRLHVLPCDVRCHARDGRGPPSPAAGLALSSGDGPPRTRGPA